MGIGGLGNSVGAALTLPALSRLGSQSGAEAET